MVSETAGSLKIIKKEQEPYRPSAEVISIVAETRRAARMPRGRARVSGWHQVPSVGIVVQQPGVMGGSPVIGGTRIRVSDVVRHQALRGASIADIRRALPHLAQDQIAMALQYYREHRAEIDAEIESERVLAADAGENPSG